MHSKAYVKMAAGLGLKFGPVRQGVTPKRILEHILQDMTRIKADNVLTSDPESIERIKGMWAAYRNVAHFIAPLTDIKNGAPPVPLNGGGSNAADVAAHIVNAVTS